MTISTGASASLAPIYERGLAESTRHVVDAAAGRIERAADLFGEMGDVRKKVFARRFDLARDHLDEGARLLGLVKAAEAQAGASSAGVDSALAGIAAWRSAAIRNIDFAAATSVYKVYNGEAGSEGASLRQLAREVRDLSAGGGADAQAALLDEGNKLAATPPAGSTVRGAKVLGVAKVGGAGLGGAGLLELAQAAARFI